MPPVATGLHLWLRNWQNSKQGITMKQVVYFFSTTKCEIKSTKIDWTLWFTLPGKKMTFGMKKGLWNQDGQKKTPLQSHMHNFCTWSADTNKQRVATRRLQYPVDPRHVGHRIFEQDEVHHSVHFVVSFERVNQELLQGWPSRNLEEQNASPIEKAYSASVLTVGLGNCKLVVTTETKGRA